MYLTNLSLTNFRSFSRLDLDVPRRVILLVGDNAQGKTTILESIYFLATLTSFHALADKQLINFLASEQELSVARLVAEFHSHAHKQKMEIRLIQEVSGNGGARLRKEILINGVKKNAQAALGAFNAVIFEPQMMNIVEGGPEERRRYLNLALAQVVPGYGQVLSDYHQALTQRNALLKQLGERGENPDQLDFWDETISQRGAILINERIQAIDALERLAARIHSDLTRQQEVFRLVYQPSYDPLTTTDRQYSLPLQVPTVRTGISNEGIKQGFLKRLSQLRSEEITRGVTTIGPHRDELRLISNGIDLGNYGSRGQVRTALLSLKLAETAWMREKTGEWPVLLMDEVLAELDDQRRSDLLTFLGESEQLLMTTTDVKLFRPGFVHGCTCWQVRAGSVAAA